MEWLDAHRLLSARHHSVAGVPPVQTNPVVVLWVAGTAYQNPPQHSSNQHSS